MTNTIRAIINLVNNPILELGMYCNSSNRANAQGDSLEEYIKDLFAGTLNEKDEQTRNKKIKEVFSYLGNDSNPPDAMLKGGDAIEVKKTEKINGSIQLNSSHPKCKLLSSSPMISESCRKAETENWEEKDLLYIVGTVNENCLKAMFMVYGIDYAASEETYLNIKNAVKLGFENLPDIQVGETNEIGRLNEVDPLKITSLRIRGMWIMQNPWKVFSECCKYDQNNKFEFCAIINLDKYLSFDNDTKELETLAKNNKNLEISEIEIKNPNDSSQLNKVKMIRFSIPNTQ